MKKGKCGTKIEHLLFPSLLRLAQSFSSVISRNVFFSIRLLFIILFVSVDKETVEPETIPRGPLPKQIKLQISIIRACGLKGAANLASSTFVDDQDLRDCALVGVNTYAVVKPSFLTAKVSFEGTYHRRRRFSA